MKVRVSLSTTALEWLDEVADSESVRKDLWVHRQLRLFAEGIMRNVRILEERGSIRLPDGRELRFVDLPAVRYAIADSKDGPGVEIEAGKFLSGRLPLAVAWVEMTASEPDRKACEWSDFSSWARIYLGARIAEAKEALDAKETREEEEALRSDPPKGS